MKTHSFKQLTTLFLALLFGVHLFGQNDEFEGYYEILPPSPEAASLGKYGEVPLNLSTGVPNISVPLFTVQGKSLSESLSLKYDASGIKVDQVPTWVGLGWSLNAGGVITRTVKGKPDDASGGWLETASMAYDMLEDCLDPAGVQVYDPNCSNNTMEIRDGVIDPEPDVFFFNFSGQSGKFYFDDQGTPIITPYIEGLKIEYTMGSYNAQSPHFPAMIGTCIGEFTFTLPNGISYVFSEKEITKDVSNNGIGHPLNYRENQVTSWFLSEITSADKKDKIHFEYQEQYLRIRARNSESKSLTQGSVTVDQESDPIFSLVNTNGLLGYKGAPWIVGLVHAFSSGSVSNNQLCGTEDKNLKVITQTRTLLLEKIISDKHTITFSKSSRTDVLDAFDLSNPQSPAVGKKLDEISIHSSKGDLIEKIDFTHTDIKSRMYLESVQRIGSDGSKIPPYSFQYNERNLLPDPIWTIDDMIISPSGLINGVDIWGYYNGVYQNSSIPTVNAAYSFGGNVYTHTFKGADRNPNGEKMKYGSLRQIDYPTGGSTLFTYEANDYSEVAGIKQVSLDLTSGATQTTQVGDQNFNYFIASTPTIESVDAVAGPNAYNNGGGIIDVSQTFTNASPSLWNQAGLQIETKLDITMENIDPDLPTLHAFQGAKVIVRDVNNPLNEWIYNWDEIIGSPSSTSINWITWNNQTIPVSATRTIILYLPPGEYELIAEAQCGGFSTASGFNIDCDEPFVSPSITPSQFGDNSGILARAIATFYHHTEITPNSPANPNGSNAGLIGGGLRIKTITNKSGNGSPDIIKNYEYVKSNGSGLSSGVLSRNPKFYFSYSSSSDVGGTQSECLYVTGFSNSKVTLGTTSGSYISYSEVREIVSQGEKGSTLSTFNTAKDYPDAVFGYDPAPYIPDPSVPTPGNNPLGIPPSYNYSAVAPSNFPYLPVTNNSWLRGDLVKKSIFDKDDFLVQETVNKYKVLEKVSEQIPSIADETRGIFVHYFNVSNSGTFTGYLKSILAPYTIRSHFKYLIESEQTDYFESGQLITTSIQNIHGSTKHLFPTHTKHFSSEGKIISKKLKYIKDYEANLPLGNGSNLVQTDLIQNNILVPPVESQSWEVDGNDSVLLNSQIILSHNFGTTNDPVIKPALIFGLEEFSSIIHTQVNENYSSMMEYGTVLHDPDFQKQAEISFDAANGNLIWVKKREGIKTSYIWDSEGQQPIASSINSEPHEIAYTSFEGANSNEGGWQFSTSGFTSSDAQTGLQSWALNSGGLITHNAVPKGSVYTVSLWAKNASISANLNGTSVPGAIVNIGSSWTYHEFQIDLSSASTDAVLTLSGTGNIDELRLHPKDAQMTSICYDLKFRTHTMTDANSRSIKYTYDGFGRLIQVRDQNGNLLSENEYLYHN